jgi:hypothetical protein
LQIELQRELEFHEVPRIALAQPACHLRVRHVPKSQEIKSAGAFAKLEVLAETRTAERELPAQKCGVPLRIAAVEGVKPHLEQAKGCVRRRGCAVVLTAYAA